MDVPIGEREVNSPRPLTCERCTYTDEEPACFSRVTLHKEQRGCYLETLCECCRDRDDAIGQCADCDRYEGLDLLNKDGGDRVCDACLETRQAEREVRVYGAY
jgi:hypothetical protein